MLDRDLQEGGKCFTQATKEFLNLIDVLVDGPFIEEEKSMLLKFKGSANQRVIDMNDYKKTGKIKELL